MKYAQIHRLRDRYSVVSLCRLLGVSESGYYAWRKRPPSPRARADARLALEIAAAHQRTRETYGPERLQSELADHGVHVGVHRIKRIRRELGLRCRQKRRFRITTDSRHTLPVAPNVLARQFSTDAPNKVWVADITYIDTAEGWLYLAGVKDLFNGEMVGYGMSARMTGRLVERRHQMRPSMSRKGNCWDNAPMESVWGLLKSELVHHQRFTTRAQATAAIREYIEIFYNRTRKQARLGYLSPAEFSRQYWHLQSAA